MPGLVPGVKETRMDKAVPAWEGSRRHSICHKTATEEEERTQCRQAQRREEGKEGFREICHPHSDLLTLRKPGVTRRRHLLCVILLSHHPRRLFPSSNLQMQKLRLRKGHSHKAQKGQRPDASSSPKLGRGSVQMPARVHSFLPSGPDTSLIYRQAEVGDVAPGRVSEGKGVGAIIACVSGVAQFTLSVCVHMCVHVLTRALLCQQQIPGHITS